MFIYFFKIVSEELGDLVNTLIYIQWNIIEVEVVGSLHFKSSGKNRFQPYRLLRS